MKAKKRLNLSIPLWWPSSPGWRRLARALTPHPGTLLTTLLVVGGLLWATSAGALPFRAPALAGDSTTTISYQGRLADSSGDPVTTSGVGMQFRLYNTDTGGSPLLEEIHAAVPVEDGLFHVLLGSTNPIPVSLLANNSTLWLGITVGADSEMTPREQIASVPYAMIASTVADGAITEDKLAPSLSLIPPGTIVMWSGSLAEIPDGWALCDGTNGTPDLTDRFILSVSASENPGETGGSHTKTLSVANLPSHTHTFTTDPAGAHSHSLYISGSAPEHPTGAMMGADGDDYSGHIGSAGEHTHTGTTDATGSGSAFDIRPKYYKLAFIMKLP
jgi:hypothetical protein